MRDIEMSENGCRHLNNFKSAYQGTQYYRIIQSLFVACTSAEARLRKARSCICFVCNEAGPRLHSCLHCIFFGCHGSHMTQHCITKKHYLTVELSYGFIYCSECSDYVYDKEFLDISKEHKIKQARSLGIGVTWRPWFKTNIECDVLKQFSKARKISSKSTYGLRGLVNLGSTCYMNAVLQALFHTPLLRAYFFSEEHKCDNNSQENKIECMMCEFARIFQEFYSGATIPLVLHNFLYYIVLHSDIQANKQQDAHEFFMVILDTLHSHCQRSIPNVQLSPHRTRIDTDAFPVYKVETCDCIIDQIFTGHLQSDIVCQECKRISTTIDPMRDIAIELLDHSSEPCSLQDCLKNYTSAESLGASVMCSYCMCYTESTKQFSFKSLPVVISFHIKRFKSLQNGVKVKIKKKISFPTEIDMSEFMASSHSSSQSTDADSGYGNASPVDLQDNRYSLFAVINHSGSFDGGHYNAYVRHYRDFWVMCDDDNVLLANLSDVLQSEGYLLFYHKHILEYE